MSPRTHIAPCSLIPPAYYAKLCSKRGRLYLHEAMLSLDRSTATDEVWDGELRRLRLFDAAKLAWGRGVHEDIKESMFYI
jgi:eukaryotic translation initiation factor 2C